MLTFLAYSFEFLYLWLGWYFYSNIFLSGVSVNLKFLEGCVLVNEVWIFVRRKCFVIVAFKKLVIMRTERGVLWKMLKRSKLTWVFRSLANQKDPIRSHLHCIAAAFHQIIRFNDRFLLVFSFFFLLRWLTLSRTRSCPAIDATYIHMLMTFCI